MPIEMEYQPEGVYIFHWFDIVKPADALELQHRAMAHAAENGIEQQVQVVDMRQLQMVAWDIQSFRDIVSINQNVLKLILVQPPAYIRLSAGAIVAMLKFVKYEIVDDYDAAVARAHALIAEVGTKTG
jgi:hypothetical protein